MGLPAPGTSRWWGAHRPSWSELYSCQLLTRACRKEALGTGWGGSGLSAKVEVEQNSLREVTAMQRLWDRRLCCLCSSPLPWGPVIQEGRPASGAPRVEGGKHLFLLTGRIPRSPSEDRTGIRASRVSWQQLPGQAETPPGRRKQPLPGPETACPRAKRQMLSQTCPATLLRAEGGEAARSGGGAQKGAPSIGADSPDSW